jgi:hypothetical protein
MNFLTFLNAWMTSWCHLSSELSPWSQHYEAFYYCNLQYICNYLERLSLVSLSIQSYVYR